MWMFHTGVVNMQRIHREQLLTKILGSKATYEKAERSEEEEEGGGRMGEEDGV